MQFRPSIPQVEPPLPPSQTLPTMYDLPSEDPEESGLPDEFHDLQPQLLSRTLRLANKGVDQSFTGSDLNLYYDPQQPRRYERPDWFLALGVPRLYEGRELRSSYVVWQEGVSPFVVVELLSPGTEAEDLGESQATLPLETVTSESPPRKWEVYERILRVPYYVVFSRYTNQLRFFQLLGGRYQEQPLNLTNPRLWIAELNLGLGLWQGTFEGVDRLWLRWYDDQENWIPTDTEREQQDKETAIARANQAEAQLQQVVRNLLQSGMSVAAVAQLTQLSETEIRQLAPE